MQDVAREMNLSETAFVVPQEDGFGLRWFTRSVEVDLCGHATLASAHVLWETGRVRDRSSIRFSTRSGVLVAYRRGGDVELDLPALPVADVPPIPGLEEALRAQPVRVARNKSVIVAEMTSEADVRRLRPDFTAMLTLPALGVIATARAEAQVFDFVSRYFGPADGIDEDPVTGAAHCSLGPYWAGALRKTELRAYQASERGGALRVRVTPDRVFLLGGAVTVSRGELIV
jgi:predicted PhzF superfamily epimerase YddE/YHI9